MRSNKADRSLKQNLKHSICDKIHSSKMRGDNCSRFNLSFALLLVHFTIVLASTNDKVRISKTIFVAEKEDSSNPLDGKLFDKFDLDIASNNQVQFDDQINTGSWSIRRPQKLSQNGAPVINGSINIKKAGFFVQNSTVYGQPQRPFKSSLNNDFLGLFDDLWKIKNKSASALIYLEHFDQRLNHNLTKSPLLPSRNLSDQMSFRPANVSAGKTNLRRPIQQISPISNNQQKCSILAQFGSLIDGWFLKANQKMVWLIDSLPLFARRQSTQSNLQRQTVNIDTSYDDDGNRKASSYDDVYQVKLPFHENNIREKSENNRPQEKIRTRRQSEMNEKEELNKSASIVAPLRCTLLNETQANKCQSTEMLVGNSLSSNFPGTMMAIEDNCRHITFLLGNCWPRELKQLSASTWNESLIAQSEYPLPTRVLPGESRICGIEPQMSEVVLSRATWMWQNLCVDKKFRQDYIEHRNCLSLWTRERAHQVCNSEYRRMQTNPTVDEYSRASAHLNYRNVVSRPIVENPVINNTIAMLPQTTNDQGQMISVTSQNEASIDNELQSKVICCTFDIFLRCVHRHATRDCGRSGGQFLINFLARIGTDDVKYICSGPKLVSHKSKLGQRKSGNNTVDKSPFLEYNYCTESKVATSIYGLSASSATDKNRHSSTWRNNNNRSSTNVNYDPTFYESDTIQPDQNAGASLQVLSICTLIPWLLAFSFNAFLLNSITGIIY